MDYCLQIKAFNLSINQSITVLLYYCNYIRPLWRIIEQTFGVNISFEQIMGLDPLFEYDISLGKMKVDLVLWYAQCFLMVYPISRVLNPNLDDATLSSLRVLRYLRFGG